MSDKRIFGYDLIKALAMFLIVLYHLGSVDFGVVPEDGWYVPNLTKCFYSFCSAGVPLFFMVNGALQASKQMSLRKCIEKSLRLIFVAVFWTVVFTCVLYPWLRGSALPNVGTFENYYWFLYTLSALYLICFLLNKWKWVQKVVLLSLLVFPFVSNLVWDVILFINPEVKMPGWGHTGVFTMYCIVYYYIGAYLQKHEMKRAVSYMLLLSGFLLVLAEVIIMSRYYHQVYDGVNASFPTIGAMLLSIGLFSLMKLVKMQGHEKLRGAISAVGRNTIGIYVFHLFFVWIINEYVFHHEKQMLIVSIFAALGIVSLTASLSNYMLKSPIKFLLKL